MYWSHCNFLSLEYKCKFKFVASQRINWRGNKKKITNASSLSMYNQIKQRIIPHFHNYKQIQSIPYSAYIHMYYTLLNICNAFYIKIDIDKLKMQRPSHSQEFFQSCILFLSFQICVCIKKKKSHQ